MVEKATSGTNEGAWRDSTTNFLEMAPLPLTSPQLSVAQRRSAQRLCHGCARSGSNRTWLASCMHVLLFFNRKYGGHLGYSTKKWLKDKKSPLFASTSGFLIQWKIAIRCRNLLYILGMHGKKMGCTLKLHQWDSLRFIEIHWISVNIAPLKKKTVYTQLKQNTCFREWYKPVLGVKLKQG